MPRSLRMILLAVAFAILAAACGKSEEKAPPKETTAKKGAVAAVLPEKAPPLVTEVEALLVIGNLQSAIDEIGAVAGRIKPQLNADGIRAILGGQMGDPLLEAFKPGAGAVVALVPGNAMLGFLEVDAGHAKQYVQAFTTRGQQAKVVDGLLILGDTLEQVARAEAMAPEIRKSVLASSDVPSLHLIVSPNRILASRPGLARIFALLNMRAQAAVRQASANPQSPETQQRLRAVGVQMVILQSLLSQVKTLELAVGAPESGVRLDLRVRPRAGTNLASFLEASRQPASQVAQLQPGLGALRVARASAPQAFTDLIRNEARNVLGKMPMSDEERALALKAVDATLEPPSRMLAIDLFAPESQRVTGSGLYTVESAEKGLEALREGVDEIGLRLIPRLRAALGTEGRIELLQNVRSHEGVAIHAVKATLDFTQLGPEAAKTLDKAVGDLRLHFAVVDKAVLWSVGDQPIEPLIDAWKKKRYPVRTR